MQEGGDAMSASKQQQPSLVPATATQDGEVRSRWLWAEASVWTERMLTALENGIKGGRWYSLIDKVFAERTLRAGAGSVIANEGAPGVDHVSVEEFQGDLEANVLGLSVALREGSYEPSAIRRVFIPKPGSSEQRPLGIPTVRDRSVQAAIRYVVEPIFEKEFADHSYGFRPQRGCKDALRRVDSLLKAGYVYVVDADLKSYFDTIPHDRLMGRLRERIADERLLGLIESFLKAGILDGLEEIDPEAGAPQGAVLSPLLSNIYLNPLDHMMARRGTEMVRYADDFVILCRSQSEAEQALQQVRQWCEAEGLTLHPDKTKIVDVRKEGFDFLGYRFATSRKGVLRRWPRVKSMAKLKSALREFTKRANGFSLGAIIDKVNRVLIGWFGYFKHSYHYTFRMVDQWVRARLRSILRLRVHRRGRGRGADHQRYPNSWFEARGYFSLEVAHCAACQPP
jgi:RNA-directed DNA polymerase